MTHYKTLEFICHSVLRHSYIYIQCYMKGNPWDETFSMLSILNSLLIWTKNTKKSKNNFKAPKKSEIVVFPGRILPCKQNKSAIFCTYSHVSGGKIKAVAANWCLIVRTRGMHLQHWLSTQRWADAIRMWPNAVRTFNRPSGIQIVCLGYFWFHRNVD